MRVREQPGMNDRRLYRQAKPVGTTGSNLSAQLSVSSPISPPEECVAVGEVPRKEPAVLAGAWPRPLKALLAAAPPGLAAGTLML